jgi:hypothetical protein
MAMQIIQSFQSRNDPRVHGSLLAPKTFGVIDGALATVSSLFWIRTQRPCAHDIASLVPILTA